MSTLHDSFYANVQSALHQLGQANDLTLDERDIVDDYAAQEFSPAACATEIVRSRRA